MECKLYLQKSRRIISYTRENIYSRDSGSKDVIILETALTNGDWTIEKEIEFFGFLSQYKVNYKNYLNITLTDKFKCSRSIKVNPNDLLDNYLASLEDLLDEYSVYNDWKELRLKEDLEKFKILLAHIDSKTIDSNDIIALEKQMKILRETFEEYL